MTVLHITLETLGAHQWGTRSKQCGTSTKWNSMHSLKMVSMHNCHDERTCSPCNVRERAASCTWKTPMNHTREKAQR